VPFVEQNYRLLADRPDARCCLVTIESLTNAPYAARIRELLARRATLHEVLFVQNLRLFEDAPWQGNVVFCFSRAPAPDGHLVKRLIARRRPSDASLHGEPLDDFERGTEDPDRLFRLREQVDLDFSDTVAWERVCYVSKGMVLHSNEKLNDGQPVDVSSDYDPANFGERLLDDGGTGGKTIEHLRFKREDLIAESPDAIHSRPYLDPMALFRGGIGRLRWIEYGENTRCPSRVSRPTFPELFDRTKVMFGTFAGIAVDDGADDFVIVSHSITISIRWSLLEGVENRALTRARGTLEESVGFAPELSKRFSEWYLCAIALSDPIQKWLHANKRSMKEHVYPDDVRAIPVKRLSQQDQQPFVRLEQERHRLWRELIELEGRGFRIGERVRIPVRELAGRFREEHPEIEHLTLFQMPTSVLEIDESAYGRDLSRARAIEGELRVGKEAIGRVGEKIRRKADVAKLFARFLQEMPGTLADRQSRDALPRSEEGLLALAGYLEEQEKAVRRRQARIEEIQAEIDRRAWDLYRPGGR
jgi:hypothetical protein